jgi:hypothetical protein
MSIHENFEIDDQFRHNNFVDIQPDFFITFKTMCKIFCSVQTYHGIITMITKINRN